MPRLFARMVGAVSCPRIPADGASGGQRTASVLWTPRAGNQSPDPIRISPRHGGRGETGETDPPLSLRDRFDSGSCPAMPGAAGAGKRSGAPMRRNPFIFFWTVRLKPHDRNRPHVRATHSGLASGVLADVPAANASLDQTVQKKKIQGPESFQGGHHERHRQAFGR